MKWKTLAIILILVIITIPSINAQFQSIELNKKDDINKTNFGHNFINVIFSFGRITNLTDISHGYCKIYGFNAVDVICIVVREDHPKIFIHRFNDGEWLGMVYPDGIITNNFILAF